VDTESSEHGPRRTLLASTPQGTGRNPLRHRSSSPRSHPLAALAKAAAVCAPSTVSGPIRMVGGLANAMDTSHLGFPRGTPDLHRTIVIGLLQGVTDVFPISSLGNSALVPAWLGGELVETGHAAVERRISLSRVHVHRRGDRAETSLPDTAIVVAVVVGENTDNVFGGVRLRALVLSATGQPETSKTGEASGASTFGRQPLSASHSDSRAPGSIKQPEVEPHTVVPPRTGPARCVLCVVSVAVEPTEQSLLVLPPTPVSCRAVDNCPCPVCRPAS